jgi:hypothetical protein
VTRLGLILLAIMMALLGVGESRFAALPAAMAHTGTTEPRSSEAGHGAAGAWRRTAQGWQRVSDWAQPPETESPALHPLTLSLLQIVCSALILAFFPAARRKQALPLPSQSSEEPVWDMEPVAS